ncbi:MAG: bifunctional phosphoribosylaminoimidazolecarboxamide formyltransferase/IMP cyclohydrolase, partial [Bacteroidota bacterium]
EETVLATDDVDEIIEKIDIGGISLIRAAAKNYKDVLIVSSVDQYQSLMGLLHENDGCTSETERREFASRAFAMSSHYDSCIFNYFNREQQLPLFRVSANHPMSLRYGENPHQKGVFYGDFAEMFEQFHGKAISYNNLLDIDAAVSLIHDFDETTVAIIKHNNACGLASRENLWDAWKDALAGDPVSAYGGIIICNKEISLVVAEEINKLFYEILIAPSYQAEALELLKSKKNRIILKLKADFQHVKTVRSLLNGFIEQEKDEKAETVEDLKTVTKKMATEKEISDMLFANKIVKHSKSNAIVLVKNNQLLGSGVGQTSRVDALQQAIAKANHFGFDLKGAVMASDAFFPFPDCVEIAHDAGISAVIQPGGSVRDNESIIYCDEHKLSMVITGFRHFKH